MNCAKTFRVRTFAVPLLALVAVAITAIPASASTMAWTVSATDSWSGYDNGNDADVFKVNSTTTVTTIGIPIVPGNVNGGIYTTFQIVGLYNSSGNPLAISVLAPVPTAISNGYYWANISPVTLLAGQSYTVVVNDNGSIPAFAYSSTDPTPGWATFDSSEFLSGGAPFTTTDPGAGNATPGIFYDINLNGAAPAVPEPESLLLLGSGLIGMAGFLRFKLRKQ